ncbi:hypothetical protein Bpfe_022878 [Biomphalaria pfeifferi]|uniref:Tyrosine specific protein phosphatases domain-containing protein n=1 Tax=Biomphalaria pfeifferi TaxID=112525 RepID=A0AAD8B479_BIOPF|nr:hypothetical protein Bpfe_022878 [Biomphalaria pfeifferi]
MDVANINTRKSGFKSSFVKIDSLPNFRLLCQRVSNKNEQSREILGSGAIYRSSKPDKIVVEDLEKIRQLSIKCIVDFRSTEEYLSTDGHCLLDAEYTLYKVCLPTKNYKPGESMRFEVISKASNGRSKSSTCPATKTFSEEPVETQNQKWQSNMSEQVDLDDASITTTTVTDDFTEDKSVQKRHYLINFYTQLYIRKLVFSLPWYLWLMGLFCLIYDIISRNKWKTFSKLLVQKSLNKKGIYGQYVDFIELSQPSICSALKLISEPDNLPVLINCAYGKDRTGIISALILTCLGMPKSYVAAEYALSTEGLEPVRHLVYQDIVGKYELTEEFCNSETETMLKLLNYIEEKYTSVEDYMCHIGFSLEEQHRLKANVEAFRHLDNEDDDDDDHKVAGVVSSKSETLSSHPKSD